MFNFGVTFRSHIRWLQFWFLNFKFFWHIFNLCLQFRDFFINLTNLVFAFVNLRHNFLLQRFKLIFKLLFDQFRHGVDSLVEARIKFVRYLICSPQKKIVNFLPRNSLRTLLNFLIFVLCVLYLPLHLLYLRFEMSYTLIQLLFQCIAHCWPLSLHLLLNLQQNRLF